jgi:phosphoglycerate dehydrogenase-like enzyme
MVVTVHSRRLGVDARPIRSWRVRLKSRYRVGMTRSLLQPDGTLDLDAIGLEQLVALGVDLSMHETNRSTLTAADMQGFDALIVENVDIPGAAIRGADDRLHLIARYGAGYDSVDVDACSARGVMVTNAPDGVRRPLATAYLALILALSLRMVPRHLATVAGRWAEGQALVGLGLEGRTLGVLGLGSVGRELLEIAAPLGMRYLVCDPHKSTAVVRSAGAQHVTLDVLARESDFVCITARLTPETEGLFGEPEFQAMRPTAFFINAARGRIVDQRALTRALRENRIAGAGLDVFETEPIDSADPLLGLDNVIVAPHAICNTDDCLRAIGHSVTASIADVMSGLVPRNLVNGSVRSHPDLAARLQRYSGGG